MSKKQTDTSWIHRIAGLAAQFVAEDKGRTLSVTSTTILGTLPGVDTWVVQVDGSETDRGEYWWPVTEYLTVSGPEAHPKIEDATDEQIRLVGGVA